jgi:hypothetical protein
VKPYTKLSSTIFTGGLLCALVLPGSARAGVLFDNLAYGNNLNSVSLSSVSWAAQSFLTGASGGSLTSVTVALEGISTLPIITDVAGVNVSLYSSTGGATPSPNSSLSLLGMILDGSLSTSNFTNQTVGGGNFALAPNTTYFIVLAGTTVGSTDALWERENGSINGIGISGQTRSESANSGTNWLSNNISSDFQPYIMQVVVDDAVPEPGTIFAAVTGLAALAAARWRKRRG